MQWNPMQYYLMQYYPLKTLLFVHPFFTRDRRQADGRQTDSDNKQGGTWYPKSAIYLLGLTATHPPTRATLSEAFLKSNTCLWIQLFIFRPTIQYTLYTIHSTLHTIPFYVLLSTFYFLYRRDTSQASELNSSPIETYSLLAGTLAPLQRICHLHSGVILQGRSCRVAGLGAVVRASHSVSPSPISHQIHTTITTTPGGCRRIVGMSCMSCNALVTTHPHMLHSYTRRPDVIPGPTSPAPATPPSASPCARTLRVYNAMAYPIPTAP